VPRLLVIHHSPSPTTRELLDSVLAGARHPDLDGVDVIARPALETTAEDVLAAHGYLLGTTANFGYMSGALKHMFDVVYHSCSDRTRNRPYGLWVHGNNDVTGAVRSVSSIVTGLGWDRVTNPVELVGPIGPEASDACLELGATVAAVVLDRSPT
jgi:multimeric flavodoxin WrbA